MGTRKELYEIFVTKDHERLNVYLEVESTADIMADLSDLVWRFATGDPDVIKIERVLGHGWIKRLADSIVPPV